MKYVLARYAEGVTLNGKEHVLDIDDNLITFDSVEEATEFYVDAGGSTDDISEDGPIYIDPLETSMIDETYLPEETV